MTSKARLAASVLVVWVGALAYGGGAACESGAANADAGGATPGALVRFAHLSPGAPAVDICIGARGLPGSFVGPMLRRLLPETDADASPTGGIQYSQVSSYFELPAGTYDVRFVPAGARDCTTSPIADVNTLPPLVAGAPATIAMMGEIAGVGDAAFALRSFTDETSAPPTRAALRFVHASPGLPPLALGVGSSAAGNFEHLAWNLRYGESTASPSVRANIAVDDAGYLEVGAVVYARVSAHASADASGDDVVGTNLVVGQGAAGTVFVIGDATRGAGALRFLTCNDAPTTGMLASCAVLAP